MSLIREALFEARKKSRTKRVQSKKSKIIRKIRYKKGELLNPKARKRLAKIVKRNSKKMVK